MSQNDSQSCLNFFCNLQIGLPFLNTCTSSFVFRPYEDQETVILRGHGGTVYGSCFFTDTRYLLSCSEDTSGSYHLLHCISPFPSSVAVTEIMRASIIVYVGYCS